MKGYNLIKKRRLIYLLAIIVLIIGGGAYYTNYMKALSKNKIVEIAVKALENPVFPELEGIGFDIKVYSKVKVIPAREKPGFTWVKFSPPIVYVSSKGRVFRELFVLVSKDGEVEQTGKGILEGYDKEDIGPVYYKIDSNAKKAIDFVDAAVKKNGYFDDEGINELSRENQVIIIDAENEYEVKITPDSGRGHEYNFDVDKKTGDVSDIGVGELADPY